MGATLDLYIDTATGELISGGSVVGGSLPTLTRNDSYTLRLRLMERQINGTYNDIDLTGATLKVGIGGIEDTPSDGSFKLIANGVTSSEIPYNASAIAVYNAISNNVSTVSLYGGLSYGYYLLTASQPNTALSFTSDTYTLFPSSTILINTRRNPATGINAQQTVQLIKNPVVYSDTFINTPTSGEAVLTKVNDGSATQNETYELALGNTVRGGLFSFNYGPNSSTGIAPLTSAITVQTQLGSVTGIGAENISVQANGKQGYTIQFVGGLGLTNISTALNLDATGLDFIPLKQTTLTMNTAELADAFAEAGEDTITTTLEIELTQNGTPKTIFQGEVTIRKDLITVGQAVPGSQASYYTAAQCDALFVEDSTANVDAANRKLVNSDGDIVINYGTGQISDATSTCLGFFGATPITRPTNTNVVSALVNLGIIDSSVTVGVVGGGGGSATFPTVCLGGTAISVFDGVNFEIGSTTGSKFATATTQKISFYGSTPITQPTGTNVLSALNSLGLISSSVTLGIPTNVVTDWSQNVSATTRTLSDSSGIVSVDWKNRALKNSSGTTAYDYQNGILGTGTAAVTISDPNIELSSSYFIKHGSGEAFQILTATASINFGTIAGQDFAEATIPVTGASENDVVMWGAPTSVATGIVFDARVTTASEITLKAFNSDNQSHTQATAIYRVVVLNFS